jgi:hypothetical protein
VSKIYAKSILFFVLNSVTKIVFGHRGVDAFSTSKIFIFNTISKRNLNQINNHMTNNLNQGNREFAGRYFGKFLMLVSLAVCCFSSKSTNAANQASLSVNEARIVGSPAFLDNSTGQLVTSASAGESSLSKNQFSLPGMSQLNVFNLAFLQVITCSQSANNDQCHYEVAGSFANNFILAITDKSIAIMLKSSSYNCFENYGSSERFQA